MECLSNDVIKNLMNDVHNCFFKKWRDRVPERDSADWDILVQDTNELLAKYGNDKRANQVILWFLERLEERMKENEKERR